jgi:dTMP kinase
VTPRSCYAAPPPGIDLAQLTGLLVVVEGPDSSGRSTQVGLLREWLERRGHGVADVGLKRSPLVASALEQAQQGNVLSPRTMSLFYATDFYDQLENRIVPALRAGYVVLADRYVFTLMARDRVRGADVGWVESLYSRALVPDAVFYLAVSSSVLVERRLRAHGSLDYWESGMDLGLSRDWMESFVIYQRRIRAQFRMMEQQYGFVSVNANRSVQTVQRELRGRLARILDFVQGQSKPPPAQQGSRHARQTKAKEAGAEIAPVKSRRSAGATRQKGAR